MYKRQVRRLGGLLSAREAELTALLEGMAPRRNPGSFVFVTSPRLPAGCTPVATVEEREGTSAVLAADEARCHGFEVADEMAWLTLDLHSP